MEPPLSIQALVNSQQLNFDRIVTKWGQVDIGELCCRIGGRLGCRNNCIFNQRYVISIFTVKISGLYEYFHRFLYLQMIIMWKIVSIIKIIIVAYSYIILLIYFAKNTRAFLVNCNYFCSENCHLSKSLDLRNNNFALPVFLLIFWSLSTCGSLRFWLLAVHIKIPARLYKLNCYFV